MGKYLFHGSYSPEGVRGVLKEGGTGRKNAVKALAESAGGRLESFYYAFGNDSYYVVVDLPSNEAAASISMAVGAVGAANVSTVVLLTPEEVDAAARLIVKYRAPGQ